MESKFEKMDEQDNIHTAYSKLYKVSEKREKFYRLATRKLSEVELEREELSTKVDEANQTIRALQFENNFLAEKTKKLDVEFFQELDWKGFQVPSWMKCSTSKKLHLTK